MFANTLRIALSLFALASMQAARAGIINFTDSATYDAATGVQTTISFDALPAGTTVTDQFADLGVIFTDGNDIWNIPSSIFYLSGRGTDDFGDIALSFSSFHNSIGVNFPGALTIDLYNDAVFLGSSNDFGGAGTGFFGGITTDVAFNRAILRDWNDEAVYIENFRFDTVEASSVPEPTTALLAGLALALIGYRHRRELRGQFT